MLMLVLLDCVEASCFGFMILKLDHLVDLVRFLPIFVVEFVEVNLYWPNVVPFLGFVSLLDLRSLSYPSSSRSPASRGPPAYCSGGLEATFQHRTTDS